MLKAKREEDGKGDIAGVSASICDTMKAKKAIFSEYFDFLFSFVASLHGEISYFKHYKY